MLTNDIFADILYTLLQQNISNAKSNDWEKDNWRIRCREPVELRTGADQLSTTRP